MRRLLIAAMLAAGCGEAAGEVDGVTEPISLGCGVESGAYLARFSHREGTCGALPDRVVQVTAATPAGFDACPGSQVRSPSGCIVHAELNCAVDAYVTDGLTMTFHWDQPVPSGSLHVVRRDSRLPGFGDVCDSVYQVTLTRL